MKSKTFFPIFFKACGRCAGWMWPLQTSSQAEAADWRIKIAASRKKKKKMQTHGENNRGCCCMSHTQHQRRMDLCLCEKKAARGTLVRSFHSRSIILLSKENSESVHSTLDGWTCCSVNITHQQTQKMFLKKMFSTLSVQAKTIVQILVILRVVVGVTLCDFLLQSHVTLACTQHESF